MFTCRIWMGSGYLNL
uniref:RR8 n=1 Tax=Arundo donax TaxID=35708 RepID=A0A0A9DE26_ARUDO